MKLARETHLEPAEYEGRQAVLLVLSGGQITGDGAGAVLSADAAEALSDDLRAAAAEVRGET